MGIDKWKKLVYNGNTRLKGEMFDEKGTILTKHTTNPVPFILVSEKNKNVKLKEDGSLANVAPTVIELMGLEKPAEMTTSMIM